MKVLALGVWRGLACCILTQQKAERKKEVRLCLHVAKEWKNKKGPKPDSFSLFIRYESLHKGGALMT